VEQNNSMTSILRQTINNFMYS